ncbi:CBS domain-containing protein [Pseudalkalibacillus caeni]|uniref:CBS domain-containing protein n=1 Tax=Exobacillus caeni TaxID=2574798 RepID=A0A5R9EZY3_9BACL|nr:CBS domain-containing protein [Pseudalkalibacillus caeni]TLS36902.1 CBS domain-containing protein [Pseudalkalibacillus caeni]
MAVIEEVMTRSVETCSPSSSVIEVAKKMKELDVGVMPLEEGNQLVGLVTDRDIVINGLAEKETGDFKARDVMTKDPECVHPDTDINEAFNLMSEKQIRRLPVVDQNNQLAGIVSIGDLAVKLNENRESGDALDQISRPAKPEK